MRTLLLLSFLSSCATAAGVSREPSAADPIPKCWKAADPAVTDGLFVVTVPPASDLRAADVGSLLFSLQDMAVRSRTVAGQADGTVVIETQFLTLEQARRLGYDTQEKLEDLVRHAFRNDLAFFARGVKIGCYREMRRH